MRPADHRARLVGQTSSRSPGALGFYGFRNRRDHSYDQLAFADSRSVRVPRVWDVLSVRGRDVIVLGVPQTYPPSRVNGAMVSCFLTPDTRTVRYTYPPELKDEIEQLVATTWSTSRTSAPTTRTGCSRRSRR